MTRAIGSLSRLVMGEEIVFGQPQSPFNGIVLSSFNYGESLRGSREELISDVITGDRARRQALQGNESAGGSLPFEVSINGIPKVLKHAIGPVATTGTGPYTHTIKRGALPVGMHIEKQFLNMSPAQYLPIGGVRVGTLNMSVANSGFITGSLDVMGKQQGALSGTPLEPAPIEPVHRPIHHKSATTQEGGGAVQIVGFEMTSANNLDENDYVIGDATKQSLDEGQSDLTGTITYRFDSATQYDKWRNETPSSVKISLVWIAANEEMTIDLPNIQYNGEVGPAIESSQGIVLAMPFRGLYDVAQQSDIIITVINNESTI